MTDGSLSSLTSLQRIPQVWVNNIHNQCNSWVVSIELYCIIHQHSNIKLYNQDGALLLFLPTSRGLRVTKRQIWCCLCWRQPQFWKVWYQSLSSPLSRTMLSRGHHDLFLPCAGVYATQGLESRRSWFGMEQLQMPARLFWWMLLFATWTNVWTIMSILLHVCRSGSLSRACHVRHIQRRSRSLSTWIGRRWCPIDSMLQLSLCLFLSLELPCALDRLWRRRYPGGCCQYYIRCGLLLCQWMHDGPGPSRNELERSVQRGTPIHTNGEIDKPGAATNCYPEKTTFIYLQASVWLFDPIQTLLVYTTRHLVIVKSKIYISLDFNN